MTAWYLLSCCSLSFSFLWLYHTLRLPCMDISEVLHWMMLSDGWCLTSSHKIWQSCSTLMVVTIMVVTRVNSETCAFMMSYMVSLPIKLPCVAFLVTYNVFIWQHFLCMRRRHSIQHIRQWKWDTANLNWCHSRRFYNAMISNIWLLVISLRGSQEKRHDTRDQPPGYRKGDLQVVHWSSW